MTNQIYTISFHKTSCIKDNRWKTPTQGEKLYRRKKQEGNLSTNQKEDSHKNRMPTLTMKIIGGKWKHQKGNYTL